MVFDLGASTGLYAREVARMGAQCVAFDRDAGCVNRERAVTAGIRKVKADLLDPAVVEERIGFVRPDGCGAEQDEAAEQRDPSYNCPYPLTHRVQLDHTRRRRDLSTFAALRTVKKCKETLQHGPHRGETDGGRGHSKRTV